MIAYFAQIQEMWPHHIASLLELVVSFFGNILFETSDSYRIFILTEALNDYLAVICAAFRNSLGMKNENFKNPIQKTRILKFLGIFCLKQMASL